MSSAEVKAISPMAACRLLDKLAGGSEPILIRMVMELRDVPFKSVFSFLFTIIEFRFQTEC